MERVKEQGELNISEKGEKTRKRERERKMVFE